MPTIRIVSAATRLEQPADTVQGVLPARNPRQRSKTAAVIPKIPVVQPHWWHCIAWSPAIQESSRTGDQLFTVNSYGIASRLLCILFANPPSVVLHICFHFILQLVRNENIKAVLSINEDYELQWFTPSSKEWQKLGVDHYQFSVVDRAPPSLEVINNAVEVIQRYSQRNECVYIHCKSGRGRSATIVAGYVIKVHITLCMCPS